VSHYAVALAALIVIGVIVAQDVTFAPFRQQTISQGLNGPGHVALDAAFGFLAIALVWVSRGHVALEICASVAALGLVGISVTNTAWRWVDDLAGKLGGHEKWHLMFTVIVFVGAAAFEVVGDRGALGWTSGANLLAPLIVWALTKKQDVTEKIAVALLCYWLIAWALSG